MYHLLAPLHIEGILLHGFNPCLEVLAELVTDLLIYARKESSHNDIKTSILFAIHKCRVSGRGFAQLKTKGVDSRNYVKNVRHPTKCVGYIFLVSGVITILHEILKLETY